MVYHSRLEGTQTYRVNMFTAILAFNFHANQDLCGNTGHASKVDGALSWDCAEAIGPSCCSHPPRARVMSWCNQSMWICGLFWKVQVNLGTACSFSWYTPLNIWCSIRCPCHSNCSNGIASTLPLEFSHPFTKFGHVFVSEELLHRLGMEN